MIDGTFWDYGIYTFGMIVLFIISMGIFLGLVNFLIRIWNYGNKLDEINHYIGNLEIECWLQRANKEKENKK